MELESSLLELGKKVKENKQIINSEEHTKMAFIVPFIKILGYDVFNPTEVVPEYTCDFGVKKGEKVDYCIMLNNAPYILIECKDCRNVLTSDNVSQLYRYYSVSSAKIAILTNGIDYMLFTDSAEKNKMDSEPFYTFSMLDIKAEDISIIELLLKGNIADFSKGSYLSLIPRVQQFKTEVDKWLNSEKKGMSKGFIKYIKKEINTYSLPDEEIEKVLREKLFAIPIEQVHFVDANTNEQIAKKGKKLSKGMSGEFSLSDDAVFEAITGGHLIYVVINNVEYDEIDSQFQIFHSIIDYALDVLKMSTKQLTEIDDNDLDFFKDKEDETNKEYRGIYFNSTMNGEYKVRTTRKLCELLHLDLENIKLGILSKSVYKEKVQNNATKDDLISFIKGE